MKRLKLRRKRKIAPIAYLKDLYAYLRLHLEGDFWDTLKPVFRASISTGCEYGELWTLYRYVLRKRPRTILELGSGVSTVVIAHAVARLGPSACRFVSMEENEAYYEQLKSIFPAHLAEYVELIRSPVEDCELEGGLIGRRYVQKPAIAYDFVFIDGPQVPKLANHFDADILDVAAWNKRPFVAFLDERINTRKALKKLLPFARVSETKGFAKFRVPQEHDRAVRYRWTATDAGGRGLASLKNG